MYENALRDFQKSCRKESVHEITRKDILEFIAWVDEGKQYHVRDVEIHGIDPQAEQALKSQFGYGQVFDVAPFRNFFEEHKGGLPTDVSLAIQVRRDLANVSVDIVLDFRPCPKM